MYLNTNIAAVNAQRNLYQTNLSMDKTLERLSSGLRINSSADDASGLAIVEKMFAQRQGLTTAIQNTQDGIALFKIAEGALNQVGKMLSRMAELAARAANQTLTSSDRDTIKDELSQLMGQINTISSDTEYNTLKLLNGNLDIKASLIASTANASNGNIKVLSIGGDAQNITNAQFTLTSIGQAAMITSNVVAATVASSIANATAIALNGVEISIAAGDNAEAIVSKINSRNSQTGVIATMTASRGVSLISGKIDFDAANIANINTGTVVGYAVVGSYNTVTGKDNRIEAGGNAAVWTFLGVINGAASITQIAVSGINATATLDGMAMSVKSSEGGTVFEMTNTGSKAYGLKIGAELYNGGYGGFIIAGANAGNSGSINSANIAGSVTTLVRIASSADSAKISLNVDNKLNLQTGANYLQALKYSISSIDVNSIGKGASSKFGSLADIKVDTAANASLSLKVVQQAIKDVSGVRATMGAIMNRLDYTDKTLQIQRENITAAESRIRDADVSLEMTAFVRQQILMQAGTSMLAQANQKPQSIMQLLR